MTNTTLVVTTGVLVCLGGVYIFLTHEQWDAVAPENSDAAVVEEVDGSENTPSGSGSWSETNDNGSPIVYQQNRVLSYGSFTVQYDVWFAYAKVTNGGDTYILRQNMTTDGTRYTSKDGTVEFTTRNGIGTLAINGSAVGSSELLNRDAIEASAPASCLEVTDTPIAGCE